MEQRQLDLHGTKLAQLTVVKFVLFQEALSFTRECPGELTSSMDDWAPIVEAFPLPPDMNLTSKNMIILTKDVSKVDFILYTETSNTKIAFGDRKSLDQSGFKKHKPVKILIHGFLSNKDSEFPSKTRQAYVEKMKKERNFNLIVVDWGKLAGHKYTLMAAILYMQAVKNVCRVGERVADFVKFLLDASAVRSLDDVHLIGFSLGAQMSGVAGMYLKRKTGKILGRITGLDPAGPLFSEKYSNLDQRLDKEDAKFVDTVHSNAGYLGTNLVDGHVDFYVNGGKRQPGCFLSLACSHIVACQLYAKTIHCPKKRYACPCKPFATCKEPCRNKILFGENISKTSRGTYYIAT